MTCWKRCSFQDLQNSYEHDLSVCTCWSPPLSLRGVHNKESGSTPDWNCCISPAEQMPSMATLDLTPRLPNGDITLPLHLQAMAFFLQEDRGKPGQQTASAQ